MNLNPMANTILNMYILAFGLIIGSFLNVCIYRMPLNKGIGGRSACPKCTKPIPIYRNIPVLTFLFQRGRSHCCGLSISFLYPLVEMTSGVLALFCVWYFKSPLTGLAWFLCFVAPLLVITVIDFRLKIIPDQISIPFILVGIIHRMLFSELAWTSALLSSLAGIFIGGGLLWGLAELISRLKKREAMGGGDIKLTAMLGAFLGFKPLIFIFFCSSILGLAYALFLRLINKAGDKTIAFGPFLAMASLIYLFFGRFLTDYYFLKILKAGMNPFFVM